MRSRIAIRAHRTRRDGLALDILEREPGLSVRGHACVVQRRDVRMPQRCQDVALTGEALGERIAFVARGMAEQQLDRHLPLEGPVRSLGQPDFSHASGADVPSQPIGADAAPFGPLGDRRLSSRLDPRQGLEERAGGDARAGVQHALELRQKAMLLRAQLLHERRQAGVVEDVGALVQARKLLPVDDRVPDHGVGAGVGSKEYVRPNRSCKRSKFTVVFLLTAIRCPLQPGSTAACRSPAPA